MFDFVQPRFAGWRVRGFGGQARGDEAGRYAIHTLLIAYKRRRADFFLSVNYAARYSASLSLRRHTQPLPARRTFFAPIERSARAWLTLCAAVGLRPAGTISGRAHSVSVGVAASPSCAVKQNRTPL